MSSSLFLRFSGNLFEGERQLKMHLKHRKTAYDGLKARLEAASSTEKPSDPTQGEMETPPASRAGSDMLQAQLEESKSILVDSYYAMATVESRKGDSEKAIKFYRRCLKLNPEHVNALLGLSSELQLLGTPEDDAKAEKLVKILSSKWWPFQLRIVPGCADNFLSLFFRLVEFVELAGDQSRVAIRYLLNGFRAFQQRGLSVPQCAS